MFECTKHGMQAAAYTSPLVHRSIIHDTPILEDLFAVKIYIDLYERYVYFWSEQSFIKEINVPYLSRNKSILIEGLGEEKSFEASLGLKGICVECYNDFLRKSGMLQANEAFEQNLFV